MEDYQKRVIEEKAELDEKISKLTNFLNGQALANSQAKLMNRQLVLMELYSQVLADRIVTF